jgi:hypothetical protein
MSERLPTGFSRAPAAAQRWWEALTSDPRWEQLGSLDRHHCVEILQLRVDLAQASSPRERTSLAKEVRKSEEALGLWQAVGRVVKPARRQRRSLPPHPGVRH